jgi:transcription antitermination protein NusB
MAVEGKEPQAKSARPRNARTRAREFAVQALYQFLVGGQTVDAIDAFTRDLAGFGRADSLHFELLLRGCTADAAALDARIASRLDRPWTEISPIEHAVMWIGVHELLHCPDVPWRVVLNECIELAKSFGGTDGHKYVNGVLNALAKELRAEEVSAGI